jgi:hypothetical protein
MTDLNDQRKALRLQIEQLLIKAAKLEEIERETNDSNHAFENHIDEWELERLVQQMQQETQRSVHEQAELRIKRIMQHNPGMLRKAARKFVEGEPLADDEFILTHRGYLREEWSDEMEREWRFLLARDYWHMLFSQLFNRV